VFNVDTSAAIHRAVTTGSPLIRRVVTVSGSAVSNPKNLNVRIGTSFEDVFYATGGFREPPVKILMGGPMTGMAQHTLASPVIKTTNALLAFAQNEPVEDQQTCIRCGKCVSGCPMNLMPCYMYMYEQKGMLADCDRLHVRDCIECGACSYVCPGRLYLVQSFRTAKLKLAAAERGQG